MVHHSNEVIKVNFSIYLSEKLSQWLHLSFKLVFWGSGTTIERFIISHKTEREELIIYGELNITEIAWKMGYSSVAHLSSQFKSHWSLPSHFKKWKIKDDPWLRK
jgi:AraC-like DNA-binding protein